MRSRAPVAGAVPGAKVHRLGAERELDLAGDDEQHLLGVSMRVRSAPVEPPGSNEAATTSSASNGFGVSSALRPNVPQLT